MIQWAMADIYSKLGSVHVLVHVAAFRGPAVWRYTVGLFNKKKKKKEKQMQTFFAAK